MIRILPESRVLSDRPRAAEPSAQMSPGAQDFPALVDAIDPAGSQAATLEPALGALPDEPMHFRDDTPLDLDELRLHADPTQPESEPLPEGLAIPSPGDGLSGRPIPESGKDLPPAIGNDIAGIAPQATGSAEARERTSAIAIARAAPGHTLTGTPSVGRAQAHLQSDARAPDDLRPMDVGAAKTGKSQRPSLGKGDGASVDGMATGLDGKPFGTGRPAEERKGSLRSSPAFHSAPQPADVPRISAIPVPTSSVSGVGRTHISQGRLQLPASREQPSQKAEIPVRSEAAPRLQAALASIEGEESSLARAKNETGLSATHLTPQPGGQTGNPSAVPSHPSAAQTAPTSASALQSPGLPDQRTDLRPPAQLENTIEHLASARDAGRSASGDVTLRHQEFGAVNMRLEVAGGDLRAVLAARDPGFVPAIQAALAERSVSAGQEASPTTSGGQSNGRGSEQSSTQQGSQSGSHSGSQTSSGASSSQSDPRYGSSPGSGQGSPQPYLPQTEASEENAARRSGAGPLEGSARSSSKSGLYA